MQSDGSELGTLDAIAHESLIGTQSASVLQLALLMKHVPLLQYSPGEMSSISIEQATNAS